MNLKNLILIIALHFICEIAFSQEPPEPKSATQQPMIYQVIEEEAQFPGGKSAMMKFIAENLRYPQAAAELGIQGRCYLQFIVTETGELTDIKVKKGVTDCPDCDKEAIRIVKLMPKWIPGKNSGKAMKSYYTLPIMFKLN
jgi:periplasmic protein TonB